MDLKFKEKFALKIQYLVGWVTFPFWGTFLIALMRFVRRYKVQQLREIRRHYKQLKRSVEGPIIVCSNHLTKIDSVILNWSLASIFSYMRSFKIFSWNLPERAHLNQNFILRVLCYLGSCVPIDRGGSRNAVKKSLDKVIYLLKKGHTITVFPEGGRSRAGRIDLDSFTYGVGKLVNKVKDCNVLCVYLRGHNQEEYSSIPP
ncbi:MAG: lysophospholipid acyltransferase family protein, partial [bacterium]